MQTEGSKGISLLWEKLKSKGPIILYNGGYGAILANIVGYYPWFATYNTMEDVLPKSNPDGTPLTGMAKLARRAMQGFCASAVSDCTSNSIRVVKVYKQTHPVRTPAFPFICSVFTLVDPSSWLSPNISDHDMCWLSATVSRRTHPSPTFSAPSR